MGVFQAQDFLRDSVAGAVHELGHAHTLTSKASLDGTDVFHVQDRLHVRNPFSLAVRLRADTSGTSTSRHRGRAGVVGAGGTSARRRSAREPIRAMAGADASAYGSAFRGFCPAQKRRLGKGGSVGADGGARLGGTTRVRKRDFLC